MQQSQRDKKSLRGSSIVEFAVGIGVLWLLFSGVYQFGYSFYIYNKLQTNVNNAAVFATWYTYDVSNTSAFSTGLKNLVVYGSLASGTKPVVPGLTTGNVDIQINPIGGYPTDITIRIKNYQIASIFARYMLQDKPRVTTLYMGKIACSAC
jgi:hypothetical protein